MDPTLDMKKVSGSNHRIKKTGPDTTLQEKQIPDPTLMILNGFVPTRKNKPDPGRPAGARFGRLSWEEPRPGTSEIKLRLPPDFMDSWL